MLINVFNDLTNISAISHTNFSNNTSKSDLSKIVQELGMLIYYFNGERSKNYLKNDNKSYIKLIEQFLEYLTTLLIAASYVSHNRTGCKYYSLLKNILAETCMNKLFKKTLIKLKRILILKLFGQ